LVSASRLHHFIDGSLALGSLDRACQDRRPDFFATLTTTDFARSSSRKLEIGSPSPNLKGPLRCTPPF